MKETNPTHAEIFAGFCICMLRPTPQRSRLVRRIEELSILCLLNGHGRNNAEVCAIREALRRVYRRYIGRMMR